MSTESERPALRFHWRTVAASARKTNPVALFQLTRDHRPEGVNVTTWLPTFWAIWQFTEDLNVLTEARSDIMVLDAEGADSAVTCLERAFPAPFGMTRVLPVVASYSYRDTNGKVDYAVESPGMVPFEFAVAPYPVVARLHDLPDDTHELSELLKTTGPILAEDWDDEDDKAWIQKHRIDKNGNPTDFTATRHTPTDRTGFYRLGWKPGAGASRAKALATTQQRKSKEADKLYALNSIAIAHRKLQSTMCEMLQRRVVNSSRFCPHHVREFGSWNDAMRYASTVTDHTKSLRVIFAYVFGPRAIERLDRFSALRSIRPGLTQGIDFRCVEIYPELAVLLESQEKVPRLPHRRRQPRQVCRGCARTLTVQPNFQSSTGQPFCPYCGVDLDVPPGVP
jgi:hypothetical protein